MLVAEQIYKTYKAKERTSIFKTKLKYVEAVKGISLKIKRGQVVGLLGVNGAGKTSTIKMLAGIIAPDRGSIVMDDIDVIKNSAKIKVMVNLISGGERNLYWRLSGRENLKYFGALYNLSKTVLAQRIETLLAIVGLTESADIAVEKYSKGMKQRLQIARGLINDPRYIFLDEPTLGLDILVAKEIRGYIKKLVEQEKKGVLLTTHYIGEAEELCDYVYIIDNGSVIAEGTFSQLKQLIPTETHTTILLEDNHTDIQSVLKRFIVNGSNPGVNFNDNTITISDSNIALNDVLSVLSELSVKIAELKKTDPKLEDVLIHLLKG